MDTKAFRAWICEAARLVVDNADRLTRSVLAVMALGRGQRQRDPHQRRRSGRGRSPNSDLP
jgi:hypothetical protein